MFDLAARKRDRVGIRFAGRDLFEETKGSEFRGGAISLRPERERWPQGDPQTGVLRGRLCRGGGAGSGGPGDPGRRLFQASFPGVRAQLDPVTGDLGRRPARDPEFLVDPLDRSRDRARDGARGSGEQPVDDGGARLAIDDVLFRYGQNDAAHADEAGNTADKAERPGPRSPDDPDGLDVGEVDGQVLAVA
ncbi:MAG: hypothetical protein MZV70_70400 [Desulfobacterales bacterium]|nr:hypothetical protein [Desulfobacterales bacterium]